MSRSRGFTLIELMITLMVVGVLVGVAVPSFQALMTRNRLVAEINELVGTLQFARSEAVKRGQDVVVCKSATGLTCTTSGNWEQGWMVFVDVDGDGAYDSGEEIINVVSALSGAAKGDVLSGSGDPVNRVRFNRLGSTPSFGSFKLCGPDNDARKARQIFIAASGRIRLAQDTDGDGVVDDGASPAKNVSCP